VACPRGEGDKRCCETEVFLGEVQGGGEVFGDETYAEGLGVWHFVLGLIVEVGI